MVGHFHSHRNSSHPHPVFLSPSFKRTNLYPLRATFRPEGKKKMFGSPTGGEGVVVCERRPMASPDWPLARWSAPQINHTAGSPLQRNLLPLHLGRPRSRRLPRHASCGLLRGSPNLANRSRVPNQGYPQRRLPKGHAGIRGSHDAFFTFGHPFSPALPALRGSVSM